VAEQHEQALLDARQGEDAVDRHLLAAHVEQAAHERREQPRPAPAGQQQPRVDDRHGGLPHDAPALRAVGEPADVGEVARAEQGHLPAARIRLLAQDEAVDHEQRERTLDAVGQRPHAGGQDDAPDAQHLARGGPVLRRHGGGERGVDVEQADAVTVGFGSQHSGLPES
jgi:hypothetical protein